MCNQCKQRTVQCNTCIAPKPLGTSPDRQHPSRGRSGRGNNVETTQATSFESQAFLPEVSLFGWQKKANQWQPVWITIAEVALSCRDLVKCGCKTNCSTKRCSCKSADLPCTELCKCKCVQGNMEVNQ